MSLKGMFKWAGAGEWSDKSADEQRESIRRSAREGYKALDEFVGAAVMMTVFFLITIAVAAVAWPLAIPVGIGLVVLYRKVWK